MPHFPTTYPNQSFFKARPYYREVLDYLQRYSAKPEVVEPYYQKRWQLRILLINLCMARAMVALWDFKTLKEAELDLLPAEMQFNGENALEVRQRLFCEFCRQLWTTKGSEFSEGVWFEFYEDIVGDEANETPELRAKVDQKANSFAEDMVEGAACHWLHESDEFDLMGGFAGYGEWQGGNGYMVRPPELSELSWNKPSVFERVRTA